MDEFTQSNDAQRGEAGQSAAWLCVWSKSSGNAERYPNHITASPPILLSCATIFLHLLRDVLDFSLACSFLAQ
jgi:hypothetical protein